MVVSKKEARVPHKGLDSWTVKVLTRLGVPPEDARVTAEVLSQANLRGVETHGSDLLPGYVNRLKAGVCKTNPDIKIVKETAATALIDGDRALGQVASVFSMKVAIQKARQAGIGWVNVFNSSHQGALAYYSLMAAKEDMIGITTTTTSRSMAPWGSREQISTNAPIAYAIPTKKYQPVVLDMATSLFANGRVRLARERNIPLPEGMALDAEGNPTIDPFKNAATLSFGTYKGSGLSMVFATLAGLLSGAPFTAYHTERVREGGPFLTDVGHLLVAVDIKNFTDVDEFKANVGDVIASWKSSARRPGFDEIYYPGEIEWNRVAGREENGIPLPGSLIKELRRIAEELEVEFPAIV